jgi:hypothetical protein
MPDVEDTIVSKIDLISALKKIKTNKGYGTSTELSNYKIH